MKFQYICSTCKQLHKGSPSFSSPAPRGYSKKLRFFDAIGKKNYLDSDFCISNGSYFIRVILEIPIIGSTEKFAWGIWVSQSEENFTYYKKHFHDDNSGKETFGWFSNSLPYYHETMNIKTNVLFQKKGKRPRIELKKTTHELSNDFHFGIDQNKAIKIAEMAMHHS